MLLSEFRPIPGMEDAFEVSGNGMVWSKPRMVDRSDSQMRVGGQFLAPARDRKGYEFVNLYYKGKRERWYMHQLVARVAIGSRPDGFDTCHNNGNKLDNRASNLRYDTRSENLRDRVRRGTHHYAMRDRCSMGHAYTSENTTTRPDRPGRVCAICRDQKPARISFERAHRRLLGKTMRAAMLFESLKGRS